MAPFSLVWLYVIIIVVLVSRISVCLLSIGSSRNPNSYEYVDNETTTDSYNLTSPAYQNPDNHIIHKVTGKAIVSSHSPYPKTLIIAFEDKHK